MTIRQALPERSAGWSIYAKYSVPRSRPPNDADGIREKLKMLLEQSVGCEWEVGREGRTLQQAEQSRAVFDELEGREGLAGRGREAQRQKFAIIWESCSLRRPWLRHGSTGGELGRLSVSLSSWLKHIPLPLVSQRTVSSKEGWTKRKSECG